jgi:hypothetical protein
VEEVLRNFDAEPEDEFEGELVATVCVAMESTCTGVPQQRQKRLFLGRSLKHLRHFVVCIGLMYHSTSAEKALTGESACPT